MTTAPNRRDEARWDDSTELIVSGALKLLPKLGYDATAEFMLDAGVPLHVVVRVLGPSPNGVAGPIRRV